MPTGDPALSAARRDEIIAMEKGARPDPSSYLPADYITAHLERFHDGVARFMTQENLDAFGIGQRDGTSFVMPKSEADALMAATGGEPRALENALGLPEGFLDTNKLVRVDIPHPDNYDLRMPSGNEAGANDQWLPGGRLPDGAREAIIDGGRVPRDYYRVTDLAAAGEEHRTAEAHRHPSVPTQPPDSNASSSGVGEEARANDGRIKISGHGTYNPEHGTAVVPEGSSVTVYAEHGARITDSLGNRIETGQDVSGVYSRTYTAGEEVPNYTLYPPGDLDVRGTPHTVQSPTQLSDLLTENMGPVDWAACVEAYFTPEYSDAPGRHLSYGVDGIGNKLTGDMNHYRQPDTPSPGTRGPGDDHQADRAPDYRDEPAADLHRRSADEVQHLIQQLATDRIGSDIGATAEDIRQVYEKAQLVREKWDDLTPQQRDAVLTHETRDGHRTTIGDLDGLPAHARDTLNRHNLVADMVDRHPSTEMKQAIRDYAHAMDEHLANPREVPRPEPLDPTGEKPSLLNRVASLFNDNAPYKNIDATWNAVYGPDAATGPIRQLLTYDPTAFNGDGRIAVAVGDLDAAHVVSVHTPGITSTIRSIEGNLVNAENHHILATSKRPDQRNAVIAWIGYDAPSGFGLARTPSDHLARLGGLRLAQDVAALAGTKGDGTRINLYGHSYGSTTTAFAGDHGRLADYVQSVTLLGSPGAGPLHHARDFGIGTENVFVASNSHDLVTWLGGSQDGHHNRLSGPLHLGGLGFDPAMREFGATRIAAEYLSAQHTTGLITAHVNYFSTEHFAADGTNTPLRFDPHARPTESLANFVDISTGDTHRLTLEAPDPRTPIPVGPDQHGRVGRIHDAAAFRTADPPTGYPGPGECVPSVLQDLGGHHVRHLPIEQVSPAGTPRAVFEEAMGTRLRAGGTADIIAATGRGEQVVVVHSYGSAGLSHGHPGAHAFLVKPNPHDLMPPLVVDRQAGATHPWPPRDLDRVTRTEMATFHQDGTPTHPMTPQERQTHVQRSSDQQPIGQSAPSTRPESEPAAPQPHRPGGGAPDHPAGVAAEESANGGRANTRPQDHVLGQEQPPNADDSVGPRPDTAVRTTSDDAHISPEPVETIMPVLERHGVTLDAFVQWQETAAVVGRDHLAEHFTREQLQVIFEARMSHPLPDPGTVMQKVLDIHSVTPILKQVDNPGSEYQGGGRFHANDTGGCMSTRPDTVGLRTPADLLLGLRLDYGKNSPFNAFTTTDHAYVVEGHLAEGEIRVPIGRIGEYLDIDHPMVRDLSTGDPPHTGTGYTGAHKGLNPEYEVRHGKWKPGATLFRIDADGSRHPVARLTDQDTWISVKDPADRVVEGWPKHEGGHRVFPQLADGQPGGDAGVHRAIGEADDITGVGSAPAPVEGSAAVRAFGESAFDTDAGVAFFDPADTTMRGTAETVAPTAGQFTVDVHGDRRGVVVRDGAGNEYRLSAPDFADLIRTQTEWDGQSPIRLLSCDTGAGARPFAQDLARELGVEVTAPDRPVWTRPDGREPVVSSLERGPGPHRELRPRIPPDGTWHRFLPDGRVQRVPLSGVHDGVGTHRTDDGVAARGPHFDADGTDNSVHHSRGLEGAELSARLPDDPTRRERAINEAFAIRQERLEHTEQSVRSLDQKVAEARNARDAATARWKALAEDLAQKEHDLADRHSESSAEEVNALRPDVDQARTEINTRREELHHREADLADAINRTHQGRELVRAVGELEHLQDQRHTEAGREPTDDIELQAARHDLDEIRPIAESRVVDVHRLMREQERLEAQHRRTRDAPDPVLAGDRAAVRKDLRNAMRRLSLSEAALVRASIRERDAAWAQLPQRARDERLTEQIGQAQRRVSDRYAEFVAGEREWDALVRARAEGREDSAEVAQLRGVQADAESARQRDLDVDNRSRYEDLARQDLESRLRANPGDPWARRALMTLPERIQQGWRIVDLEHARHLIADRRGTEAVEWQFWRQAHGLSRCTADEVIEALQQRHEFGLKPGRVDNERVREPFMDIRHDELHSVAERLKAAGAVADAEQFIGEQIAYEMSQLAALHEQDYFMAGVDFIGRLMGRPLLGDSAINSSLGTVWKTAVNGNTTRLPLWEAVREAAEAQRAAGRGGEPLDVWFTNLH